MARLHETRMDLFPPSVNFRAQTAPGCHRQGGFVLGVQGFAAMPKRSGHFMRPPPIRSGKAGPRSPAATGL
jgi:hypothetical protein